MTWKGKHFAARKLNERTSKSLIDLACGERRDSESSQNDLFVSRILNGPRASTAVIGEAVLSLLLCLLCPCGGVGMALGLCGTVFSPRMVDKWK